MPHVADRTADVLGLKYYTFISQVENGFGGVPTDSMGAWPRALRGTFGLRETVSVLLRPGNVPASV